MINTYPLGQRVTLSTGTGFLDEDGVPTDPANVYCDVVTPLGRLTTYQYGQGIDIVKVSVGVYELNVFGSVAGKYTYRWYGTDSDDEPLTAAVNQFNVDNWPQ